MKVDDREIPVESMDEERLRHICGGERMVLVCCGRACVCGRRADHVLTRSDRILTRSEGGDWRAGCW